MMTDIRNFHKKPAHLPERLTISFPIWGLYDTDGKGPYADVDRMMREHVERGFNCIRLDSGAGLIHDAEGHLLPPAQWGYAYGEFDLIMRQFGCTPPGRCDVLAHLKEMMRAAQRHGVYVILSSWYYLHTFWFNHDVARNKQLLTLDKHQRFGVFAKFLHYILLELEKEGLDTNIALCEIFNEADGLEFCLVDDEGRELTAEEKHVFRAEHEAALAWLQQEHPQLLFAFDAACPWPAPDLSPSNAQVYNAHAYFAWSAYTAFERDPSWLKEKVTRGDVAASALFPQLIQPGWIDRIHFYANLDPDRLKEAQRTLTAGFLANYSAFLDKLEESAQSIERNAEEIFPDALVVNGEGVTYCGIDAFTWEEDCPEFWQLLEKMVLRYRKAGLWGSVVRTCCGPEDPVWHAYPEKLLHINKLFLTGEDA